MESIAAQIRTTNKLVRAKAIVKGLVPRQQNPGAGQVKFIVDFEFGSVELMHNNLCPEAQGELGDKLDFIDFMNITLDGGLEYESDNQYVRIGFEIPQSLAKPTGCYVQYDSFDQDCKVTVYSSTC